MGLNVFKDYNCWSRKYKLTHPWKWIREGWINLKNGWMRATHGWCWVDLWNMDSYLLEIIPDMLRQLAIRSSGYPGHEPFETPEKWHAWLLDMAAKLESCREDNVEKLNEYYEDYINNLHLEKNIDNTGNLYTDCHDKNKELTQKYLARERELFEEAREKRTKVLYEIIKYFDYLWD